MSDHNGRDSVKLFCSIKPSLQLVETIVSCTRQLITHSGCSSCRTVSPEQLHCTLVFLGFVPTSMLPNIIKALDTVRLSVFEIITTQVVVLHPGKKHVYAVELYAPALLSLRNTIIQALESLHLDSIKERSYLPHITFARCTSACTVSPQMFSIDEQRFSLAGWQLVQSIGTSLGSIYHVIQEFELKS